MPCAASPSAIAFTSSGCSLQKSAICSKDSAVLSTSQTAVAFRHQKQNPASRVQVLVRDNNVDQALKALKKKMQREGIFREMKLRGHYEKPSEKKRAREGRGRAPRPQARPQEAAARGRQDDGT
jgi:small subunit ribosomal protein S21